MSNKRISITAWVQILILSDGTIEFTHIQHHKPKYTQAGLGVYIPCHISFREIDIKRLNTVKKV